MAHADISARFHSTYHGSRHYRYPRQILRLPYCSPVALDMHYLRILVLCCSCRSFPPYVLIRFHTVDLLPKRYVSLSPCCDQSVDMHVPLVFGRKFRLCGEIVSSFSWASSSLYWDVALAPLCALFQFRRYCMILTALYILMLEKCSFFSVFFVSVLFPMGGKFPPFASYRLIATYRMRTTLLRCGAGSCRAQITIGR